MRRSKGVYDRAGSVIAEARRGDFDWEAILEGADWFHVSGVTPAISACAADLALEAVEAARAKGVTVSCDYNYRKNLWKYGKSAPEVMRELVKHVHVGIANEEDCQQALGVGVQVDVHAGALETERYCTIAERVLAESRTLEKQFIRLRGARSAAANGWSAVLQNRRAFRPSRH